MLFLCTVFVIVLLRIERKQSPAVSSALWLPTVWILLAASRPLSSWFGVYGADIESGSPLDRIVLLAFFLAAVVILAGREFDWVRAFRENSWVILLIFYELVSICWSEIPYVSLKRWTREIIVIPMAFVVLSEVWPRQALQCIFRRTIYILIPFSVVLVKYFPAYGVEYSWSGGRAWTGVALSKNGFGRLCLIASFFLIWTLIRRWKKRDIPVVKYQTSIEVFLLLITLWLMKGPPGAYSATAMGAMVFGLAVMFGLFWLRRRNRYLSPAITATVIIVVITVGTLTPFFQGSTLSSLTSIMGRNETFTGRTDIWEVLVPAAMKYPIWGYGVGGFWTTQAVAEAFKINEAHNGYLDVILHYGFVGLLLTSMLMLSICRKAHRDLTFDYDWGALSICFLLMLVLSNITESSIHVLSNYFTAVLIFLSICSRHVVLYPAWGRPFLKAGRIEGEA